MVIVDTSVWIEYFRGIDHPETIWLERELQRQPLGLTDLILCEILQGVRDAVFQQVRADLLRFHVFENCGVKLALSAAENYRILRREGYTVRSTIDSLIATFCIQNNHRLLHRDRDYDAFETTLGLEVVHS
jgi:predicted nucleic acid-binding protein